MSVVGHKLGRRAWAAGLSAVGVMMCAIGLVTSTVAGAAEAPVGLGTADSFAVLAGAGVTNTGPTVVNGDLGTCPTPAITGFPPGLVNGTTHANDEVACGAQSDLTIAYNDAAGRAPTTTYAGPTDLVGLRLTSGVYNSPTSFANSGTLTLDGQGDPNSVFIFQAGSTLITATDSDVVLINSAQACNVFWKVGSSATLGVNSTLAGTILALESITANTGADVDGRLLARNGAVTLDSNTVTRATCATTPTSTTATAAPTTTTAAPTTTTAAPTTTTASPTTTTSAAPTTTAPTTTTTSGATTTTSAVLAPPAATATATTNATAPTSGGSTGTAGAAPSTVSPGDSTVITGAGFAPAATLAVNSGVRGAPATTMSDDNGRYSMTLRVPEGTPFGSYQVVISGTGANGEPRRSVATIQVAPRGGLPVTGGHFGPLGLLGLVMLGLGCLAALAPGAPAERRRRSRL